MNGTRTSCPACMSHDFVYIIIICLFRHYRHIFSRRCHHGCRRQRMWRRRRYLRRMCRFSSMLLESIFFNASQVRHDERNLRCRFSSILLIFLPPALTRVGIARSASEVASTVDHALSLFCSAAKYEIAAVRCFENASLRVSQSLL